MGVGRSFMLISRIAFRYDFRKKKAICEAHRAALWWAADWGVRGVWMGARCEWAGGWNGLECGRDADGPLGCG